MSSPAKRYYEFGAFRIDTNKRLLLKGDETVALTPKAFHTLLLLVENSGELVSKDDLMNRLWPDTVVEEGSLTRNIYLLRKALGEGPQEHRYIVTVPGQGYRFVADVKEVSDEGLDLRVTQRTRTTVVVTEEEADDADEELQIATAQTLTLAEPVAPTLERRALEAVSPTGSVRRHKAILLIAAIAALLAVSLAIWLYTSGKRQQPEAAPQSSQTMTIANLTTTGDVVCAAISPDGNYVAYARAESLQLNSLWIMQLATFTGQVVIPPAETQYYALTFSPDGNYIYYVTRETNGVERALYRVSRMGGPSKKLLDKVETAVAFSPDGAQIAFRRGLHDRRESALFIANADGTGEKEIAAVKYPEGIGDPAWSPDGKSIACAAGHTSGGINKYILLVSVEDRSVKPLSSKKWRWVSHISWLSDSSGLLMIASESPAAADQIWSIAYPSGEARRITNDSNYYNNLSQSADSTAAVALQSRQDTKVWTIPAEEVERARPVTFGAGGYRGRLCLTPDGKIVYDSWVGNSASVSIMDADGSNPKNLLGDMTGRAIASNSTVSPDGRYIVYSSDLTGTRNIWRMDIDGSNPVRLTGKGGEDYPHCSPDGKWVFFTDVSSEEYSIWKVSIDGGNPEQVIDEFTNFAAVSPDGKLIACFYVEPTLPWKLAVFSVEGGQAIKSFPNLIRGSPPPRWTPDGRAITYGENSIGASRIWIQPLEGGPPRKLVEIETDRVFDFDWSRDGKSLACVRGTWPRNIVLIKNFR